MITPNETEVTAKSFKQIVAEMKESGEQPSPGLLMMAEREQIYSHDTDNLVKNDCPQAEKPVRP